MSDTLHLHEEVLLLALRDQDGTIAHGTQYRYALGGALLAGLLLEGRADLELEGAKQFLRLVDDQPLGDPLLDECLVKLRTAGRRAQLRHWVARFATLSGLKTRVAVELCRKGVLRETEDRVLWLFRYKRFPEVDPRPERAIVKRLEQAIFSGSGSVAPRTAVLISLADSSGVLRVTFDKAELKKRAARIEAIVNGEVVGRATKDAVRAMQAAIAASVAIAAVSGSS